MENQRIDEYFAANGEIHSFTCAGHMDSLTFRDQCEKQYYIRPRTVQHIWCKSKWIKKNPDRKYSRAYSTQVAFPNYVDGAKPVTIGIIDSNTR